MLWSFPIARSIKLLCSQGLVQSVPGKSQALHSHQVYFNGNMQLFTAKEGEEVKTTGAESTWQGFSGLQQCHCECRAICTGNSSHEEVSCICFKITFCLQKPTKGFLGFKPKQHMNTIMIYNLLSLKMTLRKHGKALDKLRVGGEMNEARRMVVMWIEPSRMCMLPSRQLANMSGLHSSGKGNTKPGWRMYWGWGKFEKWMISGRFLNLLKPGNQSRDKAPCGSSLGRQWLTSI